MFFWIAVGAWLAGVIISFTRGNRKLPLVILLLGVFDILGVFLWNFSWLGLSALALMGVVILLANKFDAIG